MSQTWLEKHLLYVVSKFLHCILLTQYFAFHLAGTFGETFLSHPEIIDNKDQVLIDTIKVLLF